MNNRRRRVTLQNRSATAPQPPSTRDTWYRIENKAGDGSATVWLYDEVGLFGVSAAEFAKDLRGIKTDEIELRISSPGGEVYDGLAIYSALRNHKARINVFVDGVAASSASFIAQAGDTITMARNSQMMIHEAHAVSVGNSKDMRDCAELLDKCSDNIADIYAQRAGGTVQDWRARMREETWYSADEAVKAGLADQVAGKSTVGNKWDLSVFMFAGRDKAPDPFAAAGEPGLAPVSPPVNQVPTTVQAMACPSHDTATSGGTWDAGAQEKRMPSPMPVEMARKMYGWYDAAAVEDGMMPKTAGKLPHHEMGDNGPGPANLAAVRNALARLPQSDIPEADRAAVERHLRSHLSAQPEAHAGPPDEAGFFVPDLRDVIRGVHEVRVDLDLFRAAVHIGIHDVPAPDPPPPPPAPDDPEPTIDVPAVRRALKGARL